MDFQKAVKLIKKINQKRGYLHTKTGEFENFFVSLIATT